MVVSRRQRGLSARLAVIAILMGGLAIAVVLRQSQTRRKIELVDVLPGAEPQIASVLDEATHVLEALMEQLPDRPDSWHVLASFYYKFGKLDEAVKCWEKCLELAPDFAVSQYWLGVAARDRGENTEAVKWFRKALDSAPNESQVAVHLAQTLIDLGKTQDAIEVLEKNLAAYPQSFASCVLLGEVYLQLEQYDKAKQNFETAVRISSDYSSPYYGLAKACTALGQTEASNRHLAKFKELKARDEQSHRDLLKTESDLPRVQQKTAKILTLAGKVYLANGDGETAEVLLLRALELDPSEPESPQVLAWLYELQGRADRALKTLEQGCQANPQDVGVHLRLGAFHARRGRFDAAEKAIENAIRILPQQGGGYAALARLYLKSNQNLPKAKELAAKAVELEPLAENHFLLGAICQRMGDLVSARAAAEQAVALQPDNQEYRQALDGNWANPPSRSAP